MDVSNKTYDLHVGTVRAFKGLEANRVLVVDIQRFDLATEKDRDALYVALTRARHELHITGPELPALDPSLSEILESCCELSASS